MSSKHENKNASVELTPSVVGLLLPCHTFQGGF